MKIENFLPGPEIDTSDPEEAAELDAVFDYERIAEALKRVEAEGS